MLNTSGRKGKLTGVFPVFLLSHFKIDKLNWEIQGLLTKMKTFTLVNIEKLLERNWIIDRVFFFTVNSSCGLDFERLAECVNIKVCKYLTIVYLTQSLTEYLIFINIFS